MALGRVDEAKEIFDQAIARTPGGDFPYASRYKLAFLRGDANGMEQALAGLKEKSPNAVSRLLAEVAAFSGRIRAAGDLTRQAAEESVSRSNTERAGTPRHSPWWDGQRRPAQSPPRR